MADDVPVALKAADISLYKTATRGAQLQTMKPIITYWCDYWVVNQILAKGLHNTDGDILNYTTTLMDKLEQTKAEYANDAAISDDAAAQAYIEQFAQETLDRAERVIKAGKVTANTANTFDAALTFFNLVNVWGPPDTETQQKIKYAKWNAARIIKAIKEGKDPNESNPKREEVEAPTETPALDPNDPDVQLLSGSSTQGPKPATVEDAPDGEVQRDAAGVSLPHSPASVAQLPSVPGDDELKLPSAPGYGSESQPAAQPGYFDQESAAPDPVSPPTHNPVTYNTTDAPPPAAADWTPTPPPVPTVSGFPPPPAPLVSNASLPTSPAPPTGPATFASSPRPTAAVVSPPISPPVNSSFMNIAPTANVSRPVIPPPATNQAAFSPPGGFSQIPQQVTGNFTSDDMAMSQAQKHAKWAISALNFEDVPTAVRELRRALEALGAS